MLSKSCYAAPSLRDSPEGSASELSANHIDRWSGSSHSATSQQASTHQIKKVKPGQGAVIKEAMRRNGLFPGKPEGGASDNPSTGGGSQAGRIDSSTSRQQPGPISQMTIGSPSRNSPHDSWSGSSDGGGCAQCTNKKGICKC